MPLSQMPDFTFKHSEQQDALYSQYTAQQIKALFDSRGAELRTSLNALITALNSTDGAGNIGTNTIQDIEGSTIQAMLKSVRDKLKSKVNGASGADFVNASAIEGLAGDTVQAILKALKTHIDTLDTASKTSLNNHKASADHDDRYFTKDQLQSITTGNSGADLIKASPINANSGDTVQAQLKWLLDQIAVAAIGSIPDGSISEAKLNLVLANKINTSLSNIGVLSTLITNDKSNIVNAVNEIKQEATTHLAERVSKVVLVTEPFNQITKTTVNLGFKPKSVIITGAIRNSKYSSHGYADADNQYVKFSISDDSGYYDILGQQSIRFYHTTSNYITGVINLIESGIEITWASVGTLSGASGDRRLIIHAFTHGEGAI